MYGRAPSLPWNGVRRYSCSSASSSLAVPSSSTHTYSKPGSGPRRGRARKPIRSRTPANARSRAPSKVAITYIAIPMGLAGQVVRTIPSKCIPKPCKGISRRAAEPQGVSAELCADRGDVQQQVEEPEHQRAERDAGQDADEQEHDAGAGRAGGDLEEPAGQPIAAVARRADGEAEGEDHLGQEEQGKPQRRREEPSPRRARPRRGEEEDEGERGERRRADGDGGARPHARDAGVHGAAAAARSAASAGWAARERVGIRKQRGARVSCAGA